MSVTVDSSLAPKARTKAVIAALVLLLVELSIIGTLFKHVVDFNCLENWPRWVCGNASRALVAAYCVLGMAVLYRMLRPEPFRTLTQAAGDRLWPLVVNLAGLGIALIPMTFLNGAVGAAGIYPALFLWAIGLGLILSGLALFIAPWASWRAFVTTEWASVTPAVVLAGLAPWISIQLQPVWSIESIASATFTAVTKVMNWVGYELYANPETRVIGADDFFVSVAGVCSGVEGIALVTIFVTLYLWLFRADLRFPLALALYPIGIAASVTFNILRISVLLMIGLEGNPELAVGGFHSHAGWMMFTLVALGLVAAAQLIPALRRIQTEHGETHATLPPFWQDPMVAQILPFIVFMLSAVFASTFATTPSIVYPARVAIMLAVMALIIPYYRSLPWRVDPVAIGVGLFIAAYWIAIPVQTTDVAAPYGNLTGGLLVAWFVARGIGTIVLIPIIEELFFRGYLEQRLRLQPGLAWMVGAAIVTATLFAALHGRWAEAFVAGLLFSFVAARKGNITDAIVAHAVANAAIFAAAVLTGNLAMI